MEKTLAFLRLFFLILPFFWVLTQKHKRLCSFWIYVFFGCYHQSWMYIECMFFWVLTPKLNVYRMYTECMYFWVKIHRVWVKIFFICESTVKNKSTSFFKKCGGFYKWYVLFIFMTFPATEKCLYFSLSPSYGVVVTKPEVTKKQFSKSACS